jgi:hypothetical protein
MIREKIVMAACLACFATASCSVFQIRDPKQFLTAEEKGIMKRTTQTIDAGFGYDPEVELYYVFTFGYGEENALKKETDFAEQVKSVEKPNIVAYYTTMYRIKAMTAYKASWYRNWRLNKFATYVKKYLLPPMEKYTAMLQKYMIVAYPEVEAELPAIREAVDKQVLEYYEIDEKISPCPWG